MHHLYEEIIKLSQKQKQEEQYEIFKSEKQQQQNKSKSGQQAEVAVILKDQFFHEDQNIFKKEKLQNHLRIEKYSLNGKVTILLQSVFFFTILKLIFCEVKGPGRELQSGRKEP